MGIFNQLFAGEINESQRIRERTPQREKEVALCDELISTLSAEQVAMLNKFIEAYGASFDEQIEEAYTQGLKTGILMGVEAAKVEF